MPDVIAYKEGYRYQLVDTYAYHIPEAYPKNEKPIVTEYLHLINGVLTIEKGYAWDGPSGPTIDTPDSLRGSLIHDALYQLIRLGHLPPKWRRWADEMFRAILLEDGMVPERATLWYKAVRLFAGPASHPSAERPVLYAPRPLTPQEVAP